MAVAKFLTFLVVALFFQFGEAQNFYYINEVQNGHDYLLNSSYRHFSSISVILCSLVIGYYFQHIQRLLID